MNLIQLQNGIKSFGSKVLFDKAQFSVNEGDHIGVIGPNGAGKTTLFKILVNHESLDSGDVIKSQKLRIGYLQQEASEALELTGEGFLSSGSIKPIWELKKLGLSLGLNESHFKSQLKTLSGGYRMRFKLLKLLGDEPNLMLLDEPTNYLDLESILAFEAFLQSYEGAFLLISHDREFLRRTTDHTLEVEGGEITKFPGHIDDYFEQKDQMRRVLEARSLNIEAKRKSIQDFIDRFGAKATKAKQAQSRSKMLEKMEKIEVKSLPTRAQIKIPAPIHTGRDTLVITHGKLGYPNKIIISNCNLRLEKGVHLGVVGFNGAGKSTFLKSIAERLPPIEGTIKLGYQVSFSYFAQHVSEELDPNATILECLQKKAHPDLLAQDILNMAGSLLFGGDTIYKKINVLSGGEKSRVALGQILLQKSPLLILDEPTNHLDFDTVEALTNALKNYEGNVIVVSHDRGFIGRVATQILEINNGRAELYPGTYDDYLWSLEKGALKERLQDINSEYKETIRDSKKADTLKGQTEGPFTPKDNSFKPVSIKHLQAELKNTQKKMKSIELIISKNSEALFQAQKELESARGQRVSDIYLEINQLTEGIQVSEDELLTLMDLELKYTDEIKNRES